jgi:acetyl-CoA C-acetyltransferase
MTACIIGLAHTPFGKLENETVESLIVRVTNEALLDAGIEAKDVDEIVLGHFNAGFSLQDFTASLVLQADAAFRFKPATRVENACATGSAAVHTGLKALGNGKRIVLVVGVEQMTKCTNAEIGANLLKASYLPEDGATPAGFAGVFGKIAGLYFQRYGDQSDALAKIAAKNHANGVHNPYAQMRKDLGFAFCRAESEKNPFVAGPLKRTDCSLVSDGAAAIVLADSETAMKLGKAVIAFKAAAHAQDFLPMSKRDIIAFEGGATAWARALQDAGISLDDLDLVETHDCFTVAELIEYEAMGLTPKGKGALAINEGWTLKDGRLPVNPSGGLKAKGHPIGATGVSMHALCAMQLRNDAGGMQIKDAGLAGIFNMGGAAVANYVSILERLR